MKSTVNAAPRRRHLRFNARAICALLCCSAACQTYTSDLVGLDTGGTGTGGSVGAEAGKSGSTAGTPGGSDATGGTGATGGDTPQGGDMNMTGGSGGSAGSTGPTYELIDDMEGDDGDHLIIPGNKRNGFWDVSNDETPGGTQVPVENPFFKMRMHDPQHPRTGSVYEAHTAGSGFTMIWGALMEVDFRRAADFKRALYDARAYSGISFWARSAKPATTMLSVRWTSADTDPIGNVCVPGGTDLTRCYNHFSVRVPLTTEWEKYDFRFAEFKQRETGMEFDAINLEKGYTLQFAFPKDANFDLSVDDLQFIID